MATLSPDRRFDTMFGCSALIGLASPESVDDSYALHGAHLDVVKTLGVRLVSARAGYRGIAWDGGAVLANRLNAQRNIF